MSPYSSNFTGGGICALILVEHDDVLEHEDLVHQARQLLSRSGRQVRSDHGNGDVPWPLLIVPAETDQLYVTLALRKLTH